MWKPRDVGGETLRFHERLGLIDRPARTAGGYRDYGPGVIGQILFIRKAKELGSCLREIRELLKLKIDPANTCGDVRPRAQAKLLQIDRKVSALQAIRPVLESLISNCDEEKSISDCSFLKELESGNWLDSDSYW